MTLETLASQIEQAASANAAANVLAASVNAEENRRSILIVVAEGTDVAGCRSWVQQQVPGTAVVVASAVDDFTAAGLAADHVILFFPCSGIPGTQLIRNWHALIAERPAGSTSILLEGAEGIESPEDQKLVDDLVRDWLLPGEMSDEKSRSQAGALLWSDFEGKSDERHALLERIKAPLPPLARNALNLRRLAAAIELLERDAPAVAESTRPDSVTASRRSKAKAEILRATREMRDDAEASLRLAFNDLDARFDREFARLSALAAGGALHGSDLDLILSEWKSGTAAVAVERMLTRRHDDNIRLLETESVTDVTPPTLRLPSDFNGEIRPGRVEAVHLGTVTVPGIGAYLRTVGAAVCTPIAALWFGLGPVGVIGGTVVTTAGVLAFDRATRQAASVASARSQLRIQLRGQSAGWLRELQRQLDENLTQLLQDWKTAFEAVPRPVDTGATPVNQNLADPNLAGAESTKAESVGAETVGAGPVGAGPVGAGPTAGRQRIQSWKEILAGLS